jgi:dimethylamine monooxygenase subunit B
MIHGSSLQLRVAAVNDIAPGLRHLRLEDVNSAELPPSATGGHIQLLLKGERRDFRNAYSLVSKPGQQDAYEIIVRRVPESRGGSAYVHETLKAGDVLTTSWPANMFAPALSARRHLLIAGGIGITPFISYARAFAGKGVDYELHLCCRESEKSVFAPWFAEPGKVFTHWEAPGHQLDIPELLSRQPAGTHLYVCGPATLNEQVLAAAKAAGWPANHVHCESFGGHALGGKPFRAVASRSGIEVEVGAEETLLEALENAGVSVPCMCRGGVCGVCVTEVLDGEPEHRDHFLSDEEKASGKKVMPCVSRAKSTSLVLDL